MSEALSTGFASFDRLTGGLPAGAMTVLAGRPNSGKTALALNIIANVAIRAEKPVPVGVFTLETGAEQMVERLLHLLSGVGLRKARSGHLTRADQAALKDAASSLSNSAIHIDQTTPLTVEELQERARRMRTAHRIGLLVIDYFQLIGSAAQVASGSKRLDGGGVAAGLRAFAEELAIPLLVLAHLNRPPLEHRLEPPQLSDMRDADPLVSNAQTVALLWRKEATRPDQGQEVESQCIVELGIAKQENGRTGSVSLVFRPECGSFEAEAALG